MIQQVRYISQYLTHLPALTANNQSILEQHSGDPIPSTSQFLINPSTTSYKLFLGELNTEFDVKTLVSPANKERLQELNHLQKFNTPAWKGIHYKKALQSCIASPGFVGLKINEEFCHFNKTKDYLASTEQILAGLSNNIRFHRRFCCFLRSFLSFPQPRVLTLLNNAKGMLPDMGAQAVSDPLLIKSLWKVLIDRTTGCNPPQVDKLCSLPAWKVGGGLTRLLLVNSRKKTVKK